MKMFNDSGMLELTFFGKSVLATVVLGLAVLQVIAISIARGWIGNYSANTRVWATKLHRFQGYTALVIILFVAYNCVFVLGLPRSAVARVIVHALLGVTVLLLLVKKIVIARVFRRYYNWLPYLGMTLVAALTSLWITSAGWYFYNEWFG